jgi:hypothetical protein
MLMLDTQIDLGTCHHIRVKGTMCQIGGGLLLQVVNKTTTRKLRFHEEDNFS